MSDDTWDDVWLHVYAQSSWHAPAELVGTRKALKGIRDAIDQCLATSMEQMAPAMVSDGEGYSVVIRIRPVEALREEPLPYMEEYARGSAA